MPKRNRSLDSELEQYLEVIDNVLSAEHVSIQSRPLRAADLFVEHYVAEIKGDSMENHHEKRWFAIIFSIALKWYQKKYGDALTKKDSGLPCVVLIHNMPYLVFIPPTHSELDVPGESAWISFETSLGRTEKPRAWIDSPPSLAALTSRESRRLDSNLASLTFSIRTINLNLMTAAASAVEFDEMRKVAVLSLANAARHLHEATEHSLAHSVWDTHYALENAMKCLITQSGMKFTRTHNLDVLLQEAALAKKRPFTSNALRFLPKNSELIRLRYGSPLAGGLLTAHSIYTKALQLMTRITAKLDREIDFSHAKVLLKRPPWFSELPEFKKYLKQ